MFIAILIIFNQGFKKDHKGKIYIPYFLLAKFLLFQNSLLSQKQNQPN